jgi:penicillin-binding protein 2
VLLPPSSDTKKKPEERPLTPRLALRVAALGMLALGVFGVLLFRLWALQVLASTRYETLAQKNQVRHVRIPATRGWIMDKNGVPLVRNRISLDVKLDLNVLRTRDQIRRTLARLNPMTQVSVKDGLKLVDAALARHESLSPVTIAKDVPLWVRQYLAEHSWSFKGVTVSRDVVREYPQGRLAAHLFGQIYEIGPRQLKEARYNGLKSGDLIGQSGLEEIYDRWLRGTDGQVEIPVDAGSRPVGPPLQKPAPVNGFNLRLTIDAKVQRALEQSLKWGIDQTPTGKSGAMVAIDVHSGAILGMASWPNFNPNWFTSRRTKTVAGHLKWVNHSGLKPGINKAIADQYAAGSTFKPFTAVAAMMEQLITGSRLLLCSGSVKIADHTFNNWNKYAHTWMDLPTALTQSCDTYFYQLGEMIYNLKGAYGHPLQRWAGRFGFGKKTGIDLPFEIPGLLPDQQTKLAYYKQAWVRKLDSNWRADQIWHPGDEANLSIGQGDLLITPLQLAVAYAAIANGGTVVTPYVVQDVERPGRPPITFPHPKRKVAGLDPTVLSPIRDGLNGTTHDVLGTAYQVFGNFAVNVAGKTGTAEVFGPDNRPLPDNALFASYAPADNPQIAVVTIIKGGGHGGSVAAPAAMRFYAKFFGAVVPKTGDVTDNSR